MRLLIGKDVSRLLVAALLSIVGSDGASAQGFFDFLFGSPKPVQQPHLRQPGVILMTPGGRPYSLPGSVFPQQRLYDGDGDHGERADSGMKYRTLCVRMCDGYYFPISSATTRRNFYQDQARCRASCGDDARLFYHPVGQLEVDQATDNNGRVYRMLSNAFLYRKKQVSGCQCRPQPWSEAELDRHRRYAEADAAAKAPSNQIIAQLDTRRASADPTDAPATDDDATVARAPEPAPAPEPRSTAIDLPRIKPGGRIARAPSLPTVIVRTQPRNYGPQFIRLPQQAYTPAPYGGGNKPFTGGMGLTGGQLRWPGDPPRR